MGLVRALVGWPAKAEIALAMGGQESGSPVLSETAGGNSSSRAPGLGVKTIAGCGDSPKGPVEIPVDDPGVSILADTHDWSVNGVTCSSCMPQGNLGELAGCAFEFSEKN